MNDTLDKSDGAARIVAFVCKWCTYAGADLAGTSRLTYPANVRSVMLPCTGRIDVSFVLRAFLQGADGVIVSGCHPGDCHYTAGNYRARRRWTLLRDLLDVLGFDLGRLELAWISAAEGTKWVKMVTAFTERIQPFTAMKELAAEHEPAPVPAASKSSASAGAPDTSPLPGTPGSSPSPGTPGEGRGGGLQADPALLAAIAEAFAGDKVKAVVGWIRNQTLNRPAPAWVTSAQAAANFVAPGGAANLTRLLKNPQLRTVLPIGIVARTSELLALNVMAQESQIDIEKLVLFAVDDQGKLAGTMGLDAASAPAIASAKKLPADRPAGFSRETIAALDALMAKPPAQRWAFWREQSGRCIRCYACRGSCPMCSCAECFIDQNQPQWFPTAADGMGNFAWHVMRAFHLAGRCVGCGACQAACPAAIPLNILGAAMARSALKNFGHRAGTDRTAEPLQAAYRAEDGQDFIE